MEKKLAVIFPGIGYHSDKPLLYYSKKAVRQRGYDIAEVVFKGIDKSVLLGADRLLTSSKDDAEAEKRKLEAFETAFREAKEQLAEIDLSQYGDVIFVSKSIGTVVASVYAARENVPARQVYFTPLEQTFTWVEERNGLVFFGTKDPFIKTARIEELCIEKKLSYRIFENCNHSLETGELQTDLKNLTEAISDCESYLAGSPV